MVHIVRLSIQRSYIAHGEAVVLANRSSGLDKADQPSWIKRYQSGSRSHAQGVQATRQTVNHAAHYRLASLFVLSSRFVLSTAN